MAVRQRRIRFGAFEADLNSGELRKAGLAIRIQEQPFKLLLILLENPGEVINREELKSRIWPAESFGDFDHAVNVAIAKLRTALSDSAEHPQYIETLPRRGYRFIAEVQEKPEDVPRAPHLPSRVSRKRRIEQILVILFLSAAGVTGFWLQSRETVARPAATGLKMVPITSSSGASAPSFSPDGKEIAFRWDGGRGSNDKPLNPGIYVKFIGEGAPLRLTTSNGDESGPVWSPDGRHIAFVRRGQRAGIYMVSALGGPGYQIASLNSLPGYYPLSRPDWSPDGKFLAVADNPTGAQPGIFLISAVSGEKQRLTTIARPESDTTPTFSPDGKTVAFVRANDIEQDIYEVPVIGGKPHRLTYVNKPIGGAFSWTPDGKEIVFSTYGEGESHCSLWRVAATGGKPERLPFDAADEALEPVVSRQQNFLAFTRRPTNVNIWKLEFSRSHTLVHQPTKLISSTRLQSGPQFSPDGKKILFASDRSGKKDLWVCNADGSNPVQVTSLGTAGTPRWSPDGQQIVFDSPDSGVFGIYVVSVDGGAPRKVVVDSHSNAVSSWSRDGRWIYFASDRSGKYQIWKVSPHGGAPVQVTRHGGVLGLESLDGKFLYYTNDPEPSGIWKISTEGGNETLALKQPIKVWYWTIGKDGLYFIDINTKPHATIKFWSFANGRTTTISMLEQAPWPDDPALSVSPDGRSILYDEQDNVTRDIMLVENFR